MHQFGVDEAGKGPVFGSMFAAAIYLEGADRERLPDGIVDSKRLSARRRRELVDRLREDDRIRIGVAEVPTDRIDDPATDMNELAVSAHASAIEAATAGLESATDVSGLCDACDTDADRFARRVGDACGLEVSIEARHGADDDSVLVGAASIIAKVERDSHVADLAAEYGEIGSGYPSDPTTREFLESYVREHDELPPFARESWSTCEDVLAAATQTSLEGF